jgi:4-hydroxy-3-polyprenylbenzoate decarboxylase
MTGQQRKRIIVGMTGATGAILGVRLLETLKSSGIETHLVVSKWGARTLIHETSVTLERLKDLSTATYPEGDQAAPISSGSFVTEGMIVVPCSMRSLAAIAQGNSQNLVHRAADVVLKERRKLVLVVRETPLSDIHLENMLRLSRMGAVILPPVPAFYLHPRNLDEVVDHIVMRMLDQFSIHTELARRWDGRMSSRGPVEDGPAV